MLFRIDPDQAMDLVMEKARLLEAVEVEAEDALGLVLAEDLTADRDYPPFHRASMDGYAVKVEDGGEEVQVIGEVAAGQAGTMTVTAGTAVEIMTGAPCPAGTEAVVKKEEVEREGGRVKLKPSIGE